MIQVRKLSQSEPRQVGPHLICSILKLGLSQAWWYKPIIPVLGKQRKGVTTNHRPDMTNLVYMVSSKTGRATGLDYKNSKQMNHFE